MDMAVRNIINGLLCDGEARIGAALDAEAIAGEARSGYLLAAGAGLQPFLDDALAAWDGDTVRLTDNGRFASRAVASVFDPILNRKATDKEFRYSKAV